MNAEAEDEKAQKADDKSTRCYRVRRALHRRGGRRRTRALSSNIGNVSSDSYAMTVTDLREALKHRQSKRR